MGTQTYLLLAVAVAMMLPWPTIVAAGKSVASRLSGSFNVGGVRYLVAAGCIAAAVGPAALSRVGGLSTPDGPVGNVIRTYSHLMADVWTEEAALLDSGTLKTDQDSRKWLEDRRKQAQAKAFEPLATIEQTTLGDGRWTPQAAAALHRQFAAEARRVR